jgi:hypothetical protein
MSQVSNALGVGHCGDALEEGRVGSDRMSKLGRRTLGIHAYPDTLELPQDRGERCPLRVE